MFNRWKTVPDGFTAETLSSQREHRDVSHLPPETHGESDLSESLGDSIDSHKAQQAHVGDVIT